MAKDLLAEQEKSEECLKQVEGKEARINPQIDEQHLDTLQESMMLYTMCLFITICSNSLILGI